MQEFDERKLHNQLIWRSRRSLLELDLYLLGFVGGGGLDLLQYEEMQAYARILTLEDGVLLNLLINTNEVSNASMIDDMMLRIIGKIKAFHSSNKEFY